MRDEPRADRAYAPSEDIVARVIEGELILVPLVAGVGGEEDELLTFNETGRSLWRLLDGRRDLRTIASELAAQYGAAPETVERDVMGLTRELLRRRMIVEVAA